MARLPASKARQQLAAIRDAVEDIGELVVVERRGKGVAAVIPVEDLELLEALEDRYDVAAARAALAEKGRTVSWKKLKAELGL